MQNAIIDFMVELCEGYTWENVLTPTQKNELLERLKKEKLNGTYEEQYDKLREIALSFYNEIRAKKLPINHKFSHILKENYGK